MRRFFILWVSLTGVLFLSGCAGKHYTQSEPKLITIKSPKLKFSDMGYLRRDGDAVEVELFAAGVAVEKISIDKEVCVTAGCMSEKNFVKEYLYELYPADTMRRVLLGQDVFEGKGKEELCNGALYQFIRDEEMDIIYRRKPSEIYFKDRLNGLMIKILDTNVSESQTR